MSNLVDLQKSVDALQGRITAMKGGEFDEKLGKVSVYVASVARSIGTCNTILSTPCTKDQDPGKRRRAIDGQIRAVRSSISNSLRFARMNLDQAMIQALEMLAPRPRSATRVEEKKRMESLQRWFDDIQNPAKAMLDHYRDTSHPLDKYLLAGPWGFERLKNSNADVSAYYMDLCTMLRCSDPHATSVALGYTGLAGALDEFERAAKEAADELEKKNASSGA